MVTMAGVIITAYIICVFGLAGFVFWHSGSPLSFLLLGLLVFAKVNVGD